jgi:hypothetical protein
MTIQQDIAALTQSVDAMTAAVVEDATTRQQAVSDAQAAAGAAAGAVADALGERTVATGGLATGGGTLDQDLTISVPKASEAQAEAGEADDVVLTPALMKRALAALLGDTPITLPGSPVQRTVGEVLWEAAQTQFEALDIWSAFNGAPSGGDWDASTYAPWIAGIDANFSAEIASGPVVKQDRGLCSDGVNRIYSYTSGVGPFKVYLQGGLHGFEKTAQYCLMRWFEGFVRSSHSVMQRLRRQLTVVWVPTASPSGYNLHTQFGGSAGRKNSNDVDPNRNYDFYWIQYTVPNGDNAKGSAAFSEPESLLAKTILDEGAVVVVDCHAAGDGDLSGADIALAPPTAWAYSKRSFIYSVISQYAAVYGKSIINPWGGDAGKKLMGPMCTDWTSFYNTWLLRRYHAISTTIEIERGYQGSVNGVSASREAVKTYNGLVTQFLLSWLSYGMDAPRAHPITWQANRTSFNESTNLEAGGSLVASAAYQSITFEATNPGDNVSRDYLEVVAPCPGTFEIYARGYMESNGATARINSGIEINGAIIDDSLNSVQVSATDGERVSYSNSTLYEVNSAALDGRTTYKIKLKFLRFSGSTPYPSILRAQLFVKFTPNDNLHPVAYAPG